MNQSVIVWDGMYHTINNEYDGRGKFFQWSRSQYHIKLYDKGRHYKRNENILRFEVKAKKSVFLKNIYTLSDLLDETNYLYLANHLKDQLDKLVIVDTMSPEVNFNAKDQKTFDKGVNPKIWELLKDLNRTKKKRFKDQFNRLIEANKLDTIKNDLLTKVNLWIDQMCNDFTDLKGLQKFTFNKGSDTFLPLYILSNRNTIEKRYCPISGIDISNQSKDTKFAIPSTIKAISNTDSKKFHKLKHWFVNTTHHMSDLETISKKIWKGIKNKDSNSRVLFNGPYNYSDSLFPNFKIVKEDTLHISK